MIYPQRRRVDRAKTPPPMVNIWHETSFMESHWRALEGIIIRYYERGTRNERHAKIVAKDNGLGFFVKHLRSSEHMSNQNWRWNKVSYKKLAPVRASYRNREFLWIVLDGEYAGRYCKAVYAPLEPKPGESSAFFIIVFAHIVMEERGEWVTVIDTPREEQAICEDMIGVIWQTKAQRQAELAFILERSGCRRGRRRSEGRREKDQEEGKAPFIQSFMSFLLFAFLLSYIWNFRRTSVELYKCYLAIVCFELLSYCINHL
jgi:hypothetical protein